MKTAATEFIEYLSMIGIRINQHTKKELLEKEKEQIINARINGLSSALEIDSKVLDRNGSELYYQKTYQK